MSHLSLGVAKASFATENFQDTSLQLDLATPLGRLCVWVMSVPQKGMDQEWVDPERRTPLMGDQRW